MKTKLTLFALLFSVNLFAQQLNIGDVINASIGNTYRGNLQWQVSHDNVNWTDLSGETNPNLSYTITQLPTFVRAKTDEGTCQPVYSNTAIAQEQLTVTPPFNYTDTIKYIEYENLAFANDAMGLQYQIQYPNMGPRVLYFGNYTAQGQPDIIKEAKIYYGNGDTVMNIKFDDQQRFKSSYMTFNGINDSLLCSYKYLGSDSIELKIFSIYWDNDSILYRGSIYMKDTLQDSLVYLGFSNKTEEEQSDCADQVLQQAHQNTKIAAVRVIVVAAACAASMISNPAIGAWVCRLGITWAAANVLTPFDGVACAGTIESTRPPNYSPTFNAFSDSTDIITDIDGNVYNTILIGTQWWMVENLKTTRLNNGTLISNPDSTGWANIYNNSLQTPAWSNYANNAGNDAIYGKLYNWYAVNTGTLCPSGWHIPSDAEWTILIDYLGGHSLAGGALKATTLWDSPNTGATNSSGFSGLPGGIRNYIGNFSNIGNYGYIWSSTVNNIERAWYFGMYSFGAATSRNAAYKSTGLSCRCVRD